MAPFFFLVFIKLLGCTDPLAFLNAFVVYETWTNNHLLYLKNYEISLNHNISQEDLHVEVVLYDGQLCHVVLITRTTTYAWLLLKYIHTVYQQI